MSDIKEITEALIHFRNERDWEQFHNPKDLAVALNIEAGELLENFLWKSHKEADKEKVKEELADVLAYSLLLAFSTGYFSPFFLILSSRISLTSNPYFSANRRE